MSRFRRRRRVFKRSRFRKPSAKFIRSIVRSETKKVVKADQEWKFFDVTADAQNDVAAGAIVNLNSVVIGDFASRRQGNVIKQYSLQFDLRIVPLNAIPATHRIILFQVINQDATSPTVTGTEEGVLNTANVISHRNLQGSARNRFIILLDKIFNMDDLALNGTPRTFSYYKKWKNGLNTVFATDGTAPPRKNSLYLLHMSNTTSNSSFSYRSRIRFTDS